MRRLRLILAAATWLVAGSALAEEPSAPADPSTGASASSGAGRYVPAVVTGSIAVAGLTSGVGFLLVAADKSSERDDRLARLQASKSANVCGAGTIYGAECSLIKGLSDDASTLRTLSIVSFGVAAGSAVATFFLWPKTERAQKAVLFAPLLGAGVAGVGASGA